MTKPLLQTLPNDEVYLEFTPDHDEAAALRHFFNRFGYPAETTLRIQGKLFLGPVEEKSLMADFS